VPFKNSKEKNLHKLDKQAPYKKGGLEGEKMTTFNLNCLLVTCLFFRLGTIQALVKLISVS